MSAVDAMETKNNERKIDRYSISYSNGRDASQIVATSKQEIFTKAKMLCYNNKFFELY
jgi:hypothetical protein